MARRIPMVIIQITVEVLARRATTSKRAEGRERPVKKKGRATASARVAGLMKIFLAEINFLSLEMM